MSKKDLIQKIIGMCVAHDLYLTSDQKNDLAELCLKNENYLEQFFSKTVLLEKGDLTDEEFFSLTGVRDYTEETFSSLLNDDLDTYSALYDPMYFNRFLTFLRRVLGSYERCLFLQEHLSKDGDYSDEVNMPAFELNRISKRLSKYPLENINEANLFLMREAPKDKYRYFMEIHKILN